MSGSEIINVASLKPFVLDQVSTWVTRRGYPLPLGRYDAAGASITSSSTIYTCSVPRAMVVLSWSQAWYVATTNNSSNYWTISLVRKNSAGSNTTLASIDTPTYAADAWCNRLITLSASVLSTDILVVISVVKTGSPGALSLPGPGVWVR